MTVPTVHSLHQHNRQIIGIQSRGLSAPDEAVYKATLVAAYQQVIADEQRSQLHHPSLVAALQSELVALQTLTTAQLATLQSRGF